MTVFAIFQEDKMFQEKNCYTTGHQLRNVIRHAHIKFAPLGFIKPSFHLQQTPRSRHKNKAIIRLISHRSR